MGSLSASLIASRGIHHFQGTPILGLPFRLTLPQETNFIKAVQCRAHDVQKVIQYRFAVMVSIA